MPSRSVLAACAAGLPVTPKPVRRLARFPLILASTAALLLLALGSREAAAQPAPEPSADQLLRAYHDPGRAEAVGKAERRFIPVLASATTAGLDDASAQSLKRLMVHSLFEHDRTTFYCNFLVASWRNDVNPLRRALSVCTTSRETSRSACALFRYRLPILKRLMANFAALYADRRLALGPADIAYWDEILGCKDEAPEAEMPVAVKFVSDLLLTFTDRQRRGLKPFEIPERGSDLDFTAEFETVDVFHYRNRLERVCAAPPQPYEALLRTMECKATALRGK